MNTLIRFSALFAGFFLIGCAHGIGGKDDAMDAMLAYDCENEVTADVTVTVKEPETPGGNYQFEYEGGYVDDPNGKLNFRVPSSSGKPAEISFAIGKDSIGGTKFVTPGKEAMWINDGTDDVCTGPNPTGPYTGSQFFGFRSTHGGNYLKVKNFNNDHKCYKYTLRFDIPGVGVIADDPDIVND